MNKKIAENIIISIGACVIYIGAIRHFAKVSYYKGKNDGLKENEDKCKKIIDNKNNEYNELVIQYNELIDKDNELIRKLNDQLDDDSIKSNASTGLPLN